MFSKMFDIFVFQADLRAHIYSSLCFLMVRISADSGCVFLFLHFWGGVVARGESNYNVMILSHYKIIVILSYCNILSL